MPLLLVLSAAAFVSAFSYRILDPLMPVLARDLHVEAATAALLASAYAFPYALSQPVLGAFGDQWGKVRILKICLGMVTLTLAAAIVAPDFATLFIARGLAGIAAGGIIPVAFAIIGDHFPVAQRQPALARLVMASQTAILLGSSLSGLIATQVGWRAMFVVATCVSLVTFALALGSLKTPTAQSTTPLSFAKIRDQYSVILANPLAPTLLAAVAVEGMSVFGLLPYVAGRLESRGLGGTWEAGLVISAMSAGGIAYTLLVRRLLRFLGVGGVIRMGGIVSAVAMTALAYSPSWHMEALMFSVLGFGFFSIHNCLQLQATELAPTARSSSVALFAFCFFLGQASGPLLYRFGFELSDAHLPIVVGGLLLLATSFVVASRLQLMPATQS